MPSLADWLNRSIGLHRVSEVGLVISSRNRADYLAVTLADLRASELPNTTVMLVDDGSTQPAARDLIRSFEIPGCVVRTMFRPAARWSGVQWLLENWLWSRRPLRWPIAKGRRLLKALPVVGVLFDNARFFTVHFALREGIDQLLALDPSINTIVILDADMRMNPQWLVRLRALFVRERARRGPLIASSFHVAKHTVIEEFPDYRVKASLGGCCLMFDVALYHEVVRPNLQWDWDWLVVDRMRALGYPMICTRPSGVQHIGLRGFYAHPDQVDHARDFEP